MSAAIVSPQKTATHSPMLTPICFGVAVRLLVMLCGYALSGTSVMCQGDTASYLEPGHNLLAHGLFWSNGEPEIDRTPGYPLFAELTGMFWSNALATGLAQLFISAASMLLIYRISRNVFCNQRTAALAVWLYAIEPLSVLYVSRIMPETLFVLLLLVVIDCLLEYRRRGGIHRLALAGLFLAAATLVRPVSYYLTVPLTIGVFWLGRGSRNRIASGVIFLLCALAPLVGWQLRNRLETGYRGYSSIVEKNLYFFQSAEISAQLRGISLEEQQRNLGYGSDEDYLKAHPEQRSWTRPQRLQYMHLESTGILEGNAWRYAASHLCGMAIVAFSPGITELSQFFSVQQDAIFGPHRLVDGGIFASTLTAAQEHPIAIIAVSGVLMLLFILYGLAIIAVFATSPDRPSVLLLAGIAAYFIVISGGAQAVARYRIPAIPVVCMLAAGGYHSLRPVRVRATPR